MYLVAECFSLYHAFVQNIIFCISIIEFADMNSLKIAHELGQLIARPGGKQEKLESSAMCA